MNRLRFVSRFVEQQRADGRFYGECSGSVLFVDIGGFTPLTEAAFRHGGLGMEKLAATLQLVFDSLVDAVHQHGGFIANFAGDAFVAIFLGDGHESRSLDAAEQMCHANQSRGEIVANWGVFEITIKCGLDCGPIVWGLLPHQHQTGWYFRGEAVDLAGDLQSQAAVNSFVQSERHRSGSAREGTAPIPPSTPPPSTSPSAPPALSNDVLEQYFPAEVIAASRQPKLRGIVSVFMVIEGSQQHASVQQLFRLLVDQAVQWDGIVKEIGFGDKGMTSLVYFGAATARENLESNTLCFIDGLRRALNKNLPEYTIRIGIDAGPVYAGLCGGTARNEWTCIGDTVNTSARLAVAAAPGGTLVSRAIAQGAAQQWEFESSGSLRLKGKQGEFPVFEPQGPAQDGADTSYRCSMLGRETELDQLLDWVAAAVGQGPDRTSNNPQWIHVSGPPGIGKSRLVSELRRQADSLAVRWVRFPCDELRQEGWSPVILWLRNLLGVAADSTPSVIEQAVEVFLRREAGEQPGSNDRGTIRYLTTLLSTDDMTRETEWSADPEILHANQVLSVCRLLQCFAKTPLVLHLEDSQWVDSSTAQCVREIAKTFEGHAFALIVSTRDGETTNPFCNNLLAKESIHRLTLGPIASVDFVAQMAMEIVGSELHADTLSLLAKRTDGNPLYVEQLLILLQEMGQFVPSEDGRLAVRDDYWRISGKLESTLRARIDRLGEEAKRSVEHGAILGVRFLAPVLNRLLCARGACPSDTAESVTRTSLAEAKREAILSNDAGDDSSATRPSESDDAYLFRHSLIRNAAYQGQLPGVRASIHAAAFDIIESEHRNDLRPHFAELAEHARFAQHPDNVAERDYAALELAYLNRAAESARQTFRNSDAIRLYERIALVTSDAESGAAQLAAAKLRRHIGDVKQSQKQTAAALEIAERIGDIQLQSRVLDEQGEQLAGEGRQEDARDRFERALKLRQDGGDVNGEAQSVWNLAYLSYRSGDLESAARRWNRSLELAYHVGDLKLQGDCLGPLGNVERQRDRLESARKYYDQARLIHEKTGNRISAGIAIGNLGVVDHLNGQLDAARARLEEAWTIHTEVGNRRYIGRVLCDLAHLDICQDDHLVAAQRLEESIHIARSIEVSHDEALAQGYLAEVHFHFGRIPDAMSGYDNAIRLAERAGNRLTQATLLAAKAVIQARCDRGEASEKDFATAIALLDRTTSVNRLVVDIQLGHLDLARYRATKDRSHVEAASRRVATGCKLIDEPDGELQSTFLLSRALETLRGELSKNL